MSFEPLWRRMAGEIDKARHDYHDERTTEQILAERLAGVLVAAQDLIEDYRPVAGGGDPRMDVLKAELERLLKGEK